MICEPEVFPRELQNHFLQVSHLTTEAGEWIPQYLEMCHRYVHQKMSD